MMEKLSAEEVLSRYTDGERNFSWKDLSGIDLHGADLRNANFLGANLSGANLTGANLEGANLGVANLRGCQLKNIDLRQVLLARANLTDAVLIGALLPESSSAQAHPQLLSPNAVAARLAYDRVGPEKSLGLAAFLEYSYPGVGLLYCEETKTGLKVLIGTTIASVLLAILYVAAFILGGMIATDTGSPHDLFLFTIPLMIVVGPCFIAWLIFRILWARRAARTYNQRRFEMLRALREQFEASANV